jgi:glycosyltransferase involved in cell wall biosynthesis
MKNSTNDIKPRKILFCIDCLVRGGTELQLIGLIERLDPTKYEPYLLTIRDTDKTLVPDNCQHLNWRVPKLFSISGVFSFLKLIRWLKREKISIVQSYFQDSTLLAGLAAKFAKVPVRIACFRDMAFWNNNRTEKALKKVYPLMTGYISNAEAVSEHFIKQFGLKSENMKVLPNGVAIEKFAFIEHFSPVLNICIVGNMTRHVKRTDLFVKAAAIVGEKHPEIKWHIIGDGQLKQQLSDLAEGLNIRQNINFVGRIADVEQYLESMQLGILCSDSEGLSNAILEYMLKGVVCIATNVGGNPELINDEVTGCLVEPNDASMIAKKVFFLIDNISERKKLAATARAYVESRYNWENCIKEHDEYYENALSINKQK